jgi:hypothetical protein
MPTSLPPNITWRQTARYALAIVAMKVLSSLAVQPRRVLKVGGWISGDPWVPPRE